MKSNTTMPEIPKQMEWYIPSDDEVCRIPWKIHVDETTGNIEFKQVKLASGIVEIIVIAVVVGMVIFAVASFAPLPADVKMVFTIASIVIPFMVLCGSIVVTIIMNATAKQVGLFFRYIPENGEIFFPLCNIMYQPGDYSKLIFGCVCGWDTRRYVAKIGGVYWKSGKNQQPPITQLFMLFLGKDGEWRRCDIASENVIWPQNQSGSQSFVEAIDCLSPFLDFDVFVKKYSQNECFKQQRAMR